MLVPPPAGASRPWPRTERRTDVLVTRAALEFCCTSSLTRGAELQFCPVSDSHLKPTFLDALDSRVLVCDGAMGTMLYAKGVFINRSFDELNLTQPDLRG